MYRIVSVLFMFLSLFGSGLVLGGDFSYSVDFSSREFQSAIKNCPYAKIEDNTLVFNVPKDKGMTTAMISIPMEAMREACAGYMVYGEADICFFDIPKPDKSYFGVKFQFHLTGQKGNPWPSFLSLPNGMEAYGSLDWHHSRKGIMWTEEVSKCDLELGIQSANGRFLVKNIRFTRGRKCPVPTLKQKHIPQAEYTTACRNLPQLRGVMSPSTQKGPQEKDFADLEKWGANLIRWQMGFPGSSTTLESIRMSLESRFDQLEEVLKMAERHKLYVVIDVHTMKSSRPVLMGTPEGRDLLKDFWVRIAKRFGKHPNVFGFNLMNEPVSQDIEMDGPSLNEQYFRLIQAIREVEPEKPIILDCDGAGVPGMMAFMQVFPFKNVIYSPHVYLPFDLTHQLNLHQQKYLSYPDPQRGWDKEYLRKELAIIREFQQKTGARIYIGEFSCIRWAPGAEKHIADCIDLFEEYGWDWSYHAFREWQGWNVECDGDPNAPVWKETARKRVLLKAFEKNR